MWTRKKIDFVCSCHTPAESAECRVHLRPRLLVVPISEIPECCVQFAMSEEPHDRSRREAVVVQRRRVCLSQLVEEDVVANGVSGA